MRNIERRRQFFKSFEAKSLKSRSILTQFSDDLTSIFGSPVFLLLNFVFFIFWITANMGILPNIPVFDPFPYGLLTMIVSLEAIFLSIFVLVSQNHSSYISSLREEVHLRVDLIAEEEITKVLEVLAEIRREMGIKIKDAELEKMLKRIDANHIERSIMEQMSKASTPLAKKLTEEFPDILSKPIEIIQDITNSEAHSK